MIRPFGQFLVYAPAGAGKSSLFATFPKPMVVLGFDRPSKMGPYLKRGIAGPVIEGDQGQALIYVNSKNDPTKTIVQVELFLDDALTPDGTLHPLAYPRFISRLPTLFEEVREGKWATVVIDSLTFMKLATKNMHQYSLHKTERDPRKWDAQATDDLEKALCCQLTSIMTANICVAAHVSKPENKDEFAGTMVYEPSAPGRLAKRDGLAAAFGEMYTIRVTREKDTGRIIRRLQTQPDMAYNCMSVLIDAPDGLALNGRDDYNNLWSNYDAAS